MRTTLAMALMFVCSLGIGFCVSFTFSGEEIAEPASYSNVLLFLIPFGAITAIFLLFIRMKLESILIHVIMLMSWFLLLATLILLFIWLLPFMASLVLATALTLVLVFFFYFTRAKEWTRNIVGVMGGGGAIGVLGTSVSVYPLMVIMVILAIYDGLAVYKTKHMFEIADKAVEGHLPILLSLPKESSEGGDEDGNEERSTMLMGLGDIIIPGTFVISALTFVGPVAAISALGGIGVGMFLLFKAISKGGQAGLLFLNTGGIVSYFVYLGLSSIFL